MAKTVRKGLGRGIGALIGDDRPVTRSQDTGADSPARDIPTAYIRPGAAQPRRSFAEEALDELAASIKEKGILQPLIVRQTGPDAYDLIAGERRWRAAQRAGLHHVPVIIQDLDGAAALEVAIIENVQRADLSAGEEARGYKRLMDEFGHRQDDLARLIGKSRSHIANLLRLLQLPDDVRDLLDEGRISMGHARALVGHKDASALAKDIVKSGLSVRAVEALVKSDRPSGRPKKAGGSNAKDADTKALEKALSASLGLKVTIDHVGAGGEVKILYPSLEALDTLIEKLGVSL